MDYGYCLLFKERGIGPDDKFVGSQQEEEGLRLEVSIFLSTLLLALSLSLGGWCGNRRFLQGWLLFHGQLL